MTEHFWESLVSGSSAARKLRMIELSLLEEHWEGLLSSDIQHAFYAVARL